jgi:hypothetical protein
MRIKMRKKQILLILLILLLAFIVSALYFIKTNSEEPYRKLFQYCTEQESKEIKECHVLLSNYYKNDNGETCIEIVLPITDSSERDITFCLKKEDLIEWENPYNNYDLNIPVVIEIYHSNFPIIKLKNITIELMSDENARKIIYPINKNTDKLILFRSAKETNLIEEKGYYITTRICDNLSGKGCTSLGFYEGEVVDISLEGDTIAFKTNIKVLGQKKEEVFRVQSFQFEEYSYSNIEKPIKLEIVDINSDLNSIISKNEIYQMEFFILNHEEFSDSLIEQYLNRDISLDFELNRIIHYVK